MEFHEVANIFPLMSDEEFQALAADIKANGQIEPVWTYQGKIIDGRNRYKACVEVGIEPRIREWNGEEANLLPFILSLNLQRRHLSSGQKAILAIEVEKYLAVEAERRMLAGKKADPVQKVAQGKASDQAARIVGTNRQYVLDAKRVMERAPDVGAAVRSGRISLPDAALIARMPEKQRQSVLEKVPTILGTIYPDKVKQAIKVVEKEAEEEQWKLRQSQYEAELQAQIARQSTPEYKKEQKELERENERIRKQDEERRKEWTEKTDAWAAEIRAVLNDPSHEQERASLYEAAREINMHMKQAAQSYMQFLGCFNELAGWVDHDDRTRQHPPEDWYRYIRSYSVLVNNMGTDLTLDIVHLYLNFRLTGVAGSYSLPLINIEALQRWIDEPHDQEDSA